MTKHTHHIIPKYEGGSDEPFNLVELTPTQHAMWHFAEWQRKGNWQDEKAWRGLSGLLSRPELLKEIARESGRRAGITTKERGHGWWSRSKEQHSKDSGSGNVKGGWWNNGHSQGRFLLPPEGWTPGRLKGSMNWWNNGERNRRQIECPGEGWIRGRLWIYKNNEA
jgi:hypothetical protein